MIIRRYIHREILQRLFWIAGLLFLIYSSNKFVSYLADAAAGKISSALVFELLWLKLVSVLPKLLPVTLFLAVILTYSRLVGDNEMAIMFSTGISKLKQLKIVCLFVVPVCIIVASLSFFISPWAEGRIYELKIQARQDADITGIAAGQFREFSKGDRVVYVEGLSDDKTVMENIFLQVRQHGKLGVLTADRAVFEMDEASGNRYIKFEDGHRYVGVPGGLDYRITEYKTYAILLEASEAVISAGKKLESIPTAILFFSDIAQHKAELQWRISSVLSCLLLSLLAVLISQLPIGEKRYSLIFVSMLVYFIYSNLLGVSKTLLKRDEIPSIVGLWWVHALLIITLLVLYYLPQIKQRLKQNKGIQVLKATQ
ncbi:MAG: LPS export ABC transporter permease LptF [Proteobacteria bacterium]|nr:LPS export ABC transporter permease LptF [Pseudomonadota bacterium]